MGSNVTVQVHLSRFIHPAAGLKLLRRRREPIVLTLHDLKCMLDRLVDLLDFEFNIPLQFRQRLLIPAVRDLGPLNHRTLSPTADRQPIADPQPPIAITHTRQLVEGTHHAIAQTCQSVVGAGHHVG